MTIIKCKMCGGDMMNTKKTHGTCEHCGSTMTLPRIPDERRANLFNRANHFRRQNEFDKAIQAYENILNEDDTDAEAHWGVMLSRYGIEYVDEARKRVPVCHRVHHESILADADYLAALKHAPDVYTRSLYEQEAKAIGEIQKGLLAISSKEEPFDVFICYKEADGGVRTKDSAIAQDIYHQLTKEGYRVFFPKITLENKPGRQYEPYIFSALNSARVMLIICTNKEYAGSVWVKNEWSRFYALAKKDSSRLLIPCYRDIDPYDDLPGDLSTIQGYDMSKARFMHDLTHGIKTVLDRAKESASQVPPAQAAPPGIDSLMKRGHLFLEDSNWKQANEYFDKILDIDPEYAPAYAGKLCVELRSQREELLARNKELLTLSLDERGYFQKAVRFADANYRAKLEGYNEEAKRRKQELIASIKIGDVIPFGKYLWRVLDIQNGRALLLSDRITEIRKFNDSNVNVTWETCALRRYLNEEFYNSFSASENSRIVETRIINDDNPWYRTKGGSATNDKIFLLSLEDIVRYFGDSGQLRNRPGKGFFGGRGAYFINDQYNSARIAVDDKGAAVWWWLRSPGIYGDDAARVRNDGNVYVHGDPVIDNSSGVRPALRLSL